MIRTALAITLPALNAVLLGCHHTASMPPADPMPATRPAVTPFSATEVAVCEAAYRELLKNVPPGETSYLSLGETKSGWIDPPDEFIARFADMHRKIGKPSEKKWIGEHELLHHHVIDCNGKAAYVYWVKFKRWIDPDHVTVEIGRYGGSLDAFGEDGVMSRQNGKWTFESNGSSWKS